jgi:hypothetical protein
MNQHTVRKVLLICGCNKYEDYLHAAMRRMDRPEFELIGILGGSTDAEPSFNPETRILTLPVPDTYEALPSKIHAAFAWIHKERPGIPGIFKTDDDMIFDMNVLVQTVLANTNRPYWGVFTGICKAAQINTARIEHRFSDKSLRPSHQSAAYCYGWGYWISASSLPLVVGAGDEYKASFLEDVCTGFVLNRAGIVPVRMQIPYKECPRIPELLALK